MPGHAVRATFRCALAAYSTRALRRYPRRKQPPELVLDHLVALPHDQCPMADVLAGKLSGVHDGEVDVQRPHGTRIVVLVNIAPLIDDNAVIVGAVNSFCEAPLLKAVNGARTT